MLRRLFAPRKRRAPTPRPFVELHLEQLEKREVLDASLVQGLGLVVVNAYQTAQQIQQAQAATQTALNQFSSDSASYTAGKGATFTQISQDITTLHKDADRIQQLSSTFQTDSELFVMGLLGNMGNFSSDDAGPLLVEAYFLGQAQSSVNSALQTAGQASSVTPPSTVTSGPNQPRPVIGSLTASPNPVAPGGNETLTASNVTDGSSNGIITQVAFYLDSNNDGTLEAGSDMLLGNATQTSPGVWTGTANTPANTPPGTYTLFAQAKDSNGALSTPAEVPLTVTSGSNNQPVTSGSNNQSGPMIGSLIASSNPVAPGGSETLTATNVTDGSSNGTITQVAFYLDSNNDGVLEPGTDQLLGNATQTSPGVWSGTATVPANAPDRTYILFAQAKDSNSALGVPSAVALTVSSGTNNQSEPVIGSLTAGPNPVAPGGIVTLTATNVTDSSSNGTITQVAFYLDSNGDSTLEPGTDQLLGDATQISPGVWVDTFNAPAATTISNYQVFAQAKDNNGSLSAPVSVGLLVG